MFTCGSITKKININDKNKFSAQSQRKNVKYDATLEPNFPAKIITNIIIISLHEVSKPSIRFIIEFHMVKVLSNWI